MEKSPTTLKTTSLNSTPKQQGTAATVATQKPCTSNSLAAASIKKQHVKMDLPRELKVNNVNKLNASPPPQVSAPLLTTTPSVAPKTSSSAKTTASPSLPTASTASSHKLQKLDALRQKRKLNSTGHANFCNSDKFKNIIMDEELKNIISPEEKLQIKKIFKPLKKLQNSELASSIYIPSPPPPIVPLQANASSAPTLASVAPAIGNDSIQDILQFIEGGTSKKDSLKKAAKKAKQKQKKQDVKKLEELEQIREEFYDIFYKESNAKSELKLVKVSKKKDKKKIAEAESNVRKCGKTRSKIETSILELIAELKRHNNDFKFSYLPTKEQQADERLKTLNAANNVCAAEPSCSSSSSTPLVVASNASTQNAKLQKNGNVEIVHNTSVAAGSESDPSKRMVTIRRINTPYSDPQVTVTAKGQSPDKDQLLYTFINGQIISRK